MSEEKAQVGSIAWRDLTVPDAESLQRFYCDVIGWQATPHDMGEYNDFNIQQADGQTVAGICHARGANASMPAQWLIYITVEDVDACAQKCKELGGEVLDGPRSMGSHRFCVIRDPAGAVCGLIA